MPETPDFDQIARELATHFLATDGLPEGWFERNERRIAQQLRLLWYAGFEAGGQYETFVKHLKDENNEAHRALDRLDAPKTTKVPSRNYDGGTQDITIGLAARITAVVEQWKANSRENKLIAEGLLSERDALLAACKEAFDHLDGSPVEAHEAVAVLEEAILARLKKKHAK